MLNNKGFAISIILYSISGIILTVLVLILALNATNVRNNSNVAEEAKKDFYDDDLKLSDSSRFADVILKNNDVITTTPNLVGSFGDCIIASTNTGGNTDCINFEEGKAGLYKSNNTNGGTTYYFRGDNVNNYVNFAGFKWRIVRINEDETIRLILDTGINNNTSYAFNTVTGTISNMYYSNSNAKTQLQNWYTTNISNKGYSDKVATGNYFCEQAKVASNSNTLSGSSANMKLFGNYIPNFKCSTDANGKGLVNASVGLITYDEVRYAGGANNRSNDDYYLYNGSTFWTMSTAGNSTETYSWCVYSTGAISSENVSSTDDSSKLRPVINIKADTIVTGNGVQATPYVIN